MTCGVTDLLRSCTVRSDAMSGIVAGCWRSHDSSIAAAHKRENETGSEGTSEAMNFLIAAGPNADASRPSSASNIEVATSNRLLRSHDIGSPKPRFGRLTRVRR